MQDPILGARRGGHRSHSAIALSARPGASGSGHGLCDDLVRHEGADHRAHQAGETTREAVDLAAGTVASSVLGAEVR